jgi:hypothetical protein
MDDKGVWSNGCVTGTRLAIKPAPYSQLGFTSTATEGGVNWIFYQGNDEQVVVCHYQPNLAFRQAGSGRGVFQPGLVSVIPRPGYTIGPAPPPLSQGATTNMFEYRMNPDYKFSTTRDPRFFQFGRIVDPFISVQSVDLDFLRNEEMLPQGHKLRVPTLFFRRRIVETPGLTFVGVAN